MNGFLLINKPRGITSFDVIRKLRQKLGKIKMGHTGTLDPLAEGLLIIALGEGTKLIEYLMKQDKTYRAEITFGAISSTFDADGEIQPTAFKGEIGLPQLQAALAQFQGKISQTPPIYSALKIDGKKACDLARRGEKVTLAPRQIEIYNLKIQAFRYPHLILDVYCGSGTYIRSLANDFGKKLGCGGYINKLKRLQIGEISVEQNSRDAKYYVSTENVSLEAVLPLEWGIQNFTQISVNSVEAQKLQQGQALVVAQKFNDQEIVACLENNQLVSLCRFQENQKILQPLKNFNR